jgi:hypothetical protein
MRPRLKDVTKNNVVQAMADFKARWIADDQSKKQVTTA